MSPISSIYIPHIEKNITAEFIAFIFDKNEIAEVSRVAIEYNKKNKNYSAYVGIFAWHDTEIAYNFINRLNNPNKEAKIVYSDDEWWIAETNKYPHKLLQKKNRVLTIFHNSVDIQRTRQLKTLLFGEPIAPDFYPTFDDDLAHDIAYDIIQDSAQDALDFEQYLRDIDFERQFMDGRQDIINAMM